MASMHTWNQGRPASPCASGMERMIRFYFPSPGDLPPNEGRAAGARGTHVSSAAAFLFGVSHMDEHATDRCAPPEAQGLYDPRHEKDACGVGFVVHLKGKASRSIVAQGLELLHNLEHRGACGCEA